MISAIQPITILIKEVWSFTSRLSHFVAVWSRAKYATSFSKAISKQEGTKNFLIAPFLNPCLAGSWENGIKNSTARKVFGPSYFVTALVRTLLNGTFGAFLTFVGVRSESSSMKSTPVCGKDQSILNQLNIKILLTRSGLCVVKSHNFDHFCFVTIWDVRKAIVSKDLDKWTWKGHFSPLMVSSFDWNR